MGKMNSKNEGYGFTVEGLEESIKQLENLDERIKKKVAKKSLMKVARYARDEAKKNVSVRTGELKRHIVALSGRIRDRHVSESVVLVRRIRSVNIKQSVKLGKKWGNRLYMKRGGKRVKIHVYYGHMVEKGTKYSQAKPFMTPAMKKAEGYMKKHLESEISKAIREVK